MTRGRERRYFSSMTTHTTMRTADAPLAFHAANIAALRALADTASAAKSAADESLRAAESAMLAAMLAQGMGPDDAYKACGLRFAVREKLFASCDPERWDSIVAAAIAAGRPNLIQRRLNNAVALEMLMDGAAPEGLRAEPVKSLEVRKA